ncbi:MAG: YihY/virulence factor BrkB family protein [Candidatus Dormibacteraeota bacterium]|nr:YihY/virulence factor BrkB family protein [Candidatus Dormibacteraeota bacterium]
MRRFIDTAVRRAAQSYPGRLLQAFLGSQAGNYASGLAFTSFMSMFPLIAGLLAILGLVTHDPTTRSHFLQTAIGGFFPSDLNTQRTITQSLDAVRQNTGVFGVIGILGFVWGGSNLFTTMEYALGRMFGARQRDFLQQRAMAFVMTLVFALSIVVTIGLNSAVAIAGSVPLIEPVLGLLTWLLYMAAVYRIVPNRTYPLRRMWPGILMAAVLMEALSLLWTPFAGLSHNFNTYGQAFALFFLLGSWLFFLSMFTLLGAVAIRMHAGEPVVEGLIATAQREPLHTEATHAADQYSRRAA